MVWYFFTLLVPGELSIAIAIGDVLSMTDQESLLTDPILTGLKTECERNHHGKTEGKYEKSFISIVHVIRFRYC